MWPQVVSRDRQLRSARVRDFGLASLSALMRSVAEELKYFNAMEWFACRCGPLSVDLWLVWSAINVCFNVDARPCAANGSHISMPAARPVGLTLIGGRART